MHERDDKYIKCIHIISNAMLITLFCGLYSSRLLHSVANLLFIDVTEPRTAFVFKEVRRR
jgi:hypothetical protein